MPFGHNCEHPNFDSCVRTMTGKVDKPLAFCASLMRETEEKCRQRQRMQTMLDHLMKWANCDLWKHDTVVVNPWKIINGK